jgi:hypothetical protein
MGARYVHDAQVARAKRPLRLVSTERPFSRGSAGLSGQSGLLIPPRQRLEKKALSMGVCEVEDGWRFRPGRTVRNQLVQKA